MPGPSFDDLIDNVPIRYPEIGPWLTEHSSTAPLTAEQLIDLPYADSDLDDDAHEALNGWLEAAAAWGILRLIETDAVDAERWCREAVRVAWKSWSPLAPRAREVVEVAINADATRAELEAAQAAYQTFGHGPPPPYVGHFHAALACLLRYRLTRAASEIPECLARACCTPTGERATAAIAAARAATERRDENLNTETRRREGEHGEDF